MLLSKIFPNLDHKYKNLSFSSISFYSKKCKKNSIYFAISGSKHNGNLYVNEAIRYGARVIVSNKKFEGFRKNILYLKSSNPRQLLALAASKIFKDKPNNLVAVTGTNGKSSVVDFYNQILKLNNKRCGTIGTLGIKTNNSKKKIQNTTPDPLILNRILESFKKEKINNAILEASSHGLHQNRLDGNHFDVGIFTNLSRDHLDYHKSYKNYLNSKLILFKKLIKKKGCVIYDNDLSQSEKIANICKKKNIKCLTIGKKSDLSIIQKQYIKNFQQIKLSYKNKIYFLKTKLIGKVQIKNLLMSILAASNIISFKKIIGVINKIKPVNGRFQQIGNLRNESKVILDYCHSPDALEKCIKNIKDQFRFSKISIVFGCGGDRDKPKRKLMGQIANKLCDFIYLTDDNPRGEDPQKIRNQIKKHINKKKFKEFPSREKAINYGIQNLKSGDILIVAGKGHETYQEYKKKKFFSDKFYIRKYIKKKNNELSRFWKTNILREDINIKKIKKKDNIESVSTNSKEIKNNQIFVGLKGKNFNGSDFADQSIRNNVKYCIVDKLGINNRKKILVNNSLKTLTDISSKIREVSNIKTIAITGSAGKTSFKELLAQTLSKIDMTYYSKNSFNNKFGVPISLFDLNKKANFGIFEIGMSKKGEIRNLTKIVKPDIAIITNVSSAHLENFKNINGIALAKSEIIGELSSNGILILNKDDKYFKFFNKKAQDKKLKVLSFSKKSNSNSDIRLIKVVKVNKQARLYIKVKDKKINLSINLNLLPYIENLLGVITVMSIFFDVNIFKKNLFSNYNVPFGRGNFIRYRVKNKIVNIIDESYNSNPLSFEFSLNKFNNLNVNSKKKIVLLGDMLELGKKSKKLHEGLSKNLNKSDVNKVHIYGKLARYTFNKIKTQKKGIVFRSIEEVEKYLKNDFKNGDYIMIKGSNSTGLNSIISKLKA